MFIRSKQSIEHNKENNGETKSRRNLDGHPVKNGYDLVCISYQRKYRTIHNGHGDERRGACIANHLYNVEDSLLK